MNQTHSIIENPFLQAFHGTFSGALRWRQLDEVWGRVLDRRDAGWYLYTLAEAPPDAPADAVEVARFVADLDRLLRLEHREDFCGIVYADDLARPSLVKVYHPKRLGAACGIRVEPVRPAWVLSLLPPCDLAKPSAAAAQSRRWWGRLRS